MKSLKSSKKSRKNSKKLAAFTILLVLLATTIVVYFFFNSSEQTIPSKDQAVDIKKNKLGETPEVKTKDTGQLGETNQDKPSVSEASPTLDPIPQQNSPAPDAKKPIPVLISYVGGSPLTIRVLINELIQSGTCTLRLEKTGQNTVTQTAPFFTTNSSTTCQGFKVDTTNLVPGKWRVIIITESNGRTGSTSQEVNI